MVALLAVNENQARELIARLVKECSAGISDREEEALKIADKWVLDESWVRDDFAEARDLARRRKAELEAASEELGRRGREIAAAAKARKAELKAKAEPKPEPKALDGEILTGPYQGQKLLRGRRLLGYGGPEPKPAPKPEMPQAEGPLRETEAALKASALAEAMPEAEEPGARIMLPALIPPSPPLQQSPNWDDVIAVMNKQHAIIENVGGKTVIASWEPSPIDLGRLMVVFQTKESFLLRYSNRFISIEVPNARGGSHSLTTPLGQWWLGHRDRLQFRGVTFRPGDPKIVNECLNLWQGWGVEAKPGDWGLIREHIEKVLAGGNEEFAEYLIRWIAWSVQNPAAPAEVALVLIGEKGAGKGTLVRCLRRIFGAHAFQVTSREEVIGKFNGHLQDCVLFVADEAYWGGDKRCVGRLQGMITEETLPIERKGIDLGQVPNYLHVVMLAEPGWVIPAERFERRYAALAVSTARRGDREYFRALHRQIEEGGAGAMFYDLQAMELERWHPREIPDALLRNPALQEQQVHTLPPWEQWYVMLLHNGKVPGAFAKRPNTSFTHSLLANARELPRLRWEASDCALRDFLIDKKRLGIACTKYRASTANGWSFPPLPECRAAWEQIYGPTTWDSDVSDWGNGG